MMIKKLGEQARLPLLPSSSFLFPVCCFQIDALNTFFGYLVKGIKIFNISVYISMIYPILVIFDTISAMTDISILDRYIMKILDL